MWQWRSHVNRKFAVLEWLTTMRSPVPNRWKKLSDTVAITAMSVVATGIRKTLITFSTVIELNEAVPAKKSMRAADSENL